MKSFIFKMSLFASIIFLFVYFVNSWAFALLILLVAEFFWETQTPISRTYFHKFIPTKLRATIGSVESMILSIAGILALPLVGYLLDLIGAKYVIMISGIIGIIGAFTYLKINENKKISGFEDNMTKLKR
jgi:predicted MFS family arabinose efflux permease